MKHVYFITCWTPLLVTPTYRNKTMTKIKSKKKPNRYMCMFHKYFPLIT